MLASKIFMSSMCVRPTVRFFSTLPLNTSRLYLRPIEQADKEFLARDIYSDPDVMKWYRYGVPEDEASVEKYVDRSVNSWKAGNQLGTFIVCKKESDEPIGEVGLIEGDKPGEAELYYAFATKSHGKGLGMEAINAVAVDYARRLYEQEYRIKNKPFSKIIATVHPENAGSAHILENKLDMQFKGEIERFDAPRKVYSKRFN